MPEEGVVEQWKRRGSGVEVGRGVLDRLETTFD